MIKAVLFDIDGVLLDSFTANVSYFQALLIKAGYPKPSEEKLRTIIVHNTLRQSIIELTNAPEEEVQRIYELGEKLLKDYPHHLLTMPHEAEETIIELSRNYRLGIVTSRIRDGIYSMPQLANLKKYFQAAVGFEDTEKHKPDPDPLLFACSKLGVKPDETVYIGDTETDLLAGKTAKMKVILYAPENFVKADIYTANFNKLPEIISDL